MPLLPSLLLRQPFYPPRCLFLVILDFALGLLQQPFLLPHRQRPWFREHICEQLCALRPESNLGVRVWDGLYMFQCDLAHGAKSAERTALVEGE
jgi:hypothetical protein